MIEINSDKFINITNMSKDTFLNTSKQRKIKSLEKLGYKVLNIKGMGVSSVFICELSEDMKLKQDLEEVIGVSIKYPKVMNKYFSLLLSDSMDVSFYSDRKIAELLFKYFDLDLSVLKLYIIQCRKELVEAGMMKPIVRDKRSPEATERKYILRNNINYEEEIIDTNEAINNWRDLYYKKIEELTNIAKVNSTEKEVSDECSKQIRQQANKHMQEQLNGNMYVVFKKEFSLNKFKK